MKIVNIISLIRNYGFENLVLNYVVLELCCGVLDEEVLEYILFNCFFLVLNS